MDANSHSDGGLIAKAQLLALEVRRKLGHADHDGPRSTRLVDSVRRVGVAVEVAVRVYEVGLRGSRRLIWVPPSAVSHARSSSRPRR